MAPASAKAGTDGRPRTLQTKSFTRFEPVDGGSPLSPTRHRASTIQTPSSTTTDPSTPAEQGSKRHASDIFDKRQTNVDEDASPILERSQSLPDHFDELPIELASLTDRCAALS